MAAEYKSTFGNISGPITQEQQVVIYAILITLIVLYSLLFCFTAINFWRIIIKQKKFMLIPLLIFYLSAFVILVARVIDNVAFYKFYKHGQNINGDDYMLGCKASMVSTFANIIMGIF